MATAKPKELFFVHPIYARGEHVIGENAVSDNGHINMVRIGRGEKRQVSADAAQDLIISGQAIDFRNSKPEDLVDAKAFVEERNRIENPDLKKKAA